METIKLEEIVGYLPYKLKAEMLDYKRDYVGKQYDEIIGLKEWSREGDWCLLTDGGSKPSLDKFKPILHSIESLTEFREDLGFVPIEWISKNIRSNVEFHQPLNLTYNLEINIETENYTQTVDLFDGYLITQKLYEWHIDIHNLIPRNLAIDIKTLK